VTSRPYSTRCGISKRRVLLFANMKTSSQRQRRKRGVEQRRNATRGSEDAPRPGIGNSADHPGKCISITRPKKPSSVSCKLIRYTNCSYAISKWAFHVSIYFDPVHAPLHADLIPIASHHIFNLYTSWRTTAGLRAVRLGLIHPFNNEENYPGLPPGRE